MTGNREIKRNEPEHVSVGLMRMEVGDVGKLEEQTQVSKLLHLLGYCRK